MNSSKIHINKEYIISKISGRWGLRRKIEALKIKDFQRIKILKEKKSFNYLVSLEGQKRKKTIPKYYFNYIHLLSTEDENYEQKSKEINSQINVNIFGSADDNNIDIFDSQTEYYYKKYKFCVSNLPSVNNIHGNNYENKKLRNTVLTNFPDVFIGVIDAANLEADLFLATQFIDMDAKLVLVIKNHQLLKNFDYELLGTLLGTPIIAYSCEDVNNKKINAQIIDTVINTHYNSEPKLRHIHINFGRVIENSINKITKHLEKNKENDLSISPRYTAINLLEKDKIITKVHKKCQKCINKKCIAEKQISKLESLYKGKIEDILDNARKSFVRGAVAEVKADIAVVNNVTKKLDRILTHKLWGVLSFIMFIFLMFFTTFEIGKYPMNWLESLIDWLSIFASDNIKNQFFKDMVVQGALGGIGGILVFLPNIFILFFFIGLLENTGYMSRAAFVMDKYMHIIGLHGKSFIPLIMGFGCTVPAILSTKILDNRRDRILTMMILPFFSCSARLPVYILIISAFFPKYPILMLVLIYSLGILVAIITSLFFSKTILKQNEAPYIMELRPYVVPTLKISIYYMWNRSKEFVKKIGGIILIGSLIIWALGYFPKEVEYSKKYDYLIEKSNNQEEIDELLFQKQSEKHAKSYIGKIGNLIEPLMRPLGFDWKMSVAILSGIAGKEITVSTMGVLYQAKEQDGEFALQEKLKNEVYISGEKKGQKVFNEIVAMAFIVFVLIYFPCIAVISTIWKISKKFYWALFSALYTTALAWVLSFLVYRIGNYFF